MATKSFDAGLDFLPETKSVRKGQGILGMLKVVYEAFEEGREAEAKYCDLVARGTSHAVAARMVLAGANKH